MTHSLEFSNWMATGEFVNGSQISLVNNKLTRFESEAFKTVLEQMVPYSPHSFVNIDKSKNILKSYTVRIFHTLNCILDLRSDRLSEWPLSSCMACKRQSSFAFSYSKQRWTMFGWNVVFTASTEQLWTMPGNFLFLIFW